MNKRELDKKLRRANPVPANSSRQPRAIQLWRTGKVVAAVLAAFALGVGVTWAATGTNPVTSAFTKSFEVGESKVGLDSFSIIRPITQEDLDSLPRGVAMAAHMHAEMKTISENLRKGRAPFGTPKPTREHPFQPDPSEISAIGSGYTNEGTEFTLLVVDDEICVYTGPRGFGMGNCGSLDWIQKKALISASSDGGGPNLTRLMGLVTDEVKEIKVAGSSAPPIPVQNVFEIRHLKPVDITVIGLDGDGNEVFREGVPVSFYGNP